MRHSNTNFQMDYNFKNNYGKNSRNARVLTTICIIISILRDELFSGKFSSDQRNR